MAGSKHKMTGCARFLIFFLVFAPVAYFAASYYNGGDPVGDIRRIISGDDSDRSDDSDAIDVNEVEELQEEVDDLKKENKRLRKQIESLQEQ